MRLCFLAGSAALVLSLVLLFSGCATRTASFPDVAIHPCSQYEHYQERDDLAIAVDAYFERERAKDCFGIDLLAQGILPVLVVAENHHSKAAFLLDKKKFLASRADHRDNGSDVVARSREPAMPYSQDAIRDSQTAGTLTTMAGLAPVLLVPAILIGGPSAAEIRSTTAINQNLRDNAFIDRTLFPGEAHSGFIYFQMRDATEIQAIAGISIRVTNMVLDEELAFDFEVQTER